ncbi:hypothetical protein I3843_15G118000 [Carya illinoinensis]|uniref:Microbial collagenase n=1 Tax=Carya illinoinensis TaxID=32201 RepID=A0A8T1N781_CARIL|nr:uncharacterized protein LOC122295563 [Carya illinoinensis]KAG2667552.1 hypothetical protein I3760_15G121300 [Carya illinoinensis]KAG6627579.1 hypothetical protein CIPAW_15G139000 [Carya illinoinensis]KAG7944726.1 hypothetical protein I3843_15G118000 [Carya illinoinensis]
MGSQAALSLSHMMLSCSSSPFGFVVLNSSLSKTLLRPSIFSQTPPYAKPINSLSLKATKQYLLRFPGSKTRATLDEREQSTAATPFLDQDEQPNKEVEESVEVLKKAAKTRKVSEEEVLSALSVIEKAKIDPSGFLDTLGGSKSPGRTWMLIFTAEKQVNRGRYFPLTAIQRFDAAAKRIENGVYLGPIGCLTFEGRFSWKQRILAFIFECIRIKIGPLKPLEISLGQKDDRDPSNKDPFFIWFYVDEEIAVARGKSGGTAFWCRCRRVTT